MSDRPSTSAPAEGDDAPSTSPQSITKQFKYEKLELPTVEQLAQTEFMNLCISRAVMSCIGGGVMGVAFGVVMGALDTSSLDPVDSKKQKTTLQVLRESARVTRDRSLSYAKAFSSIGFLYAGIECCVEKHRGKHDIYNAVYAGCATGALLGRSGGAFGICGGCASFAVFSALIERFMVH